MAREVFDWTIPERMEHPGCYAEGTRVRRRSSTLSNTICMSCIYSVPVRRKMPLEELKAASVFALPDHPEWIPRSHVLLQGELGVLSQSETTGWLLKRENTKLSSIQVLRMVT